jgi:regulator of sigma E protease
MPSVLVWLGLGLGVAVLFSLAVFVHEYGHYWVARLCGLRVDGFSIGFGPKILGWTDKQGVEWAIRCIPAGGFVKLPQMITSEMIEGQSEPGLPQIRPIHKILVAVAGPVMNIILAFVLGGLIWAIGLPVPLNHTIIGFVPNDSPESRLGIKEGDRIVSIDGRKMQNWEDIQTTAALALTNVLQVEILHVDGRSATYPIATEVQPSLNLKFLRFGPKDHPVVKEVVPDSAAAAAGLRPGDEFVSFSGIQIAGQRQLIGLIEKRPNVASVVELTRDGKLMRLELTPRMDPKAKVGRIGVVIGYSDKLTYTLQRPGPTPWAQVSGTVSRMFQFARALSHQKESNVGVENLNGPVGIFTMMASELRVDPRRAIALLVVLNVNLALLNLLPLPVLDGGHILMALFEIVTGIRIRARVQEGLTLAFALLLMGFMLFVTFNDVRGFPRLRGALKQESVIQPTPKPVTPTPAPVTPNPTSPTPAAP